MIRLRTGLFFSLLTLTYSIKSQTVRISIFNETPVKSIVVSSLKGNYRIYADSAYIMDLSKNDAMYISMFGQQLLLRNAQKSIGNFEKLRFEAADSNAVFRLNAISPNADARQYNDNLQVSIAFNRILLVNEVQADNYLAGVVEAEAGPNSVPEFYKAQSILARTFLFGHITRHQSEGFQLCDGVHCQAYKGRAARNPAIAEATKAVTRLVVVSQDSTYITAMFHANCGGETESAENVWLNKKSYLLPVKDPFCINSSSAHWAKTIPLEQWKTYLTGHGFKIPKHISPGKFDYSQINRKQYYKIGKDSIPNKQIRTDFQLKSTCFSVVASVRDITINGRGYGHGVGMCQEGAMQMGKIGYKYDEILNYYYKNILILKH